MNIFFVQWRSILSNDDLSDLVLGCLPRKFVFYLSIDLLSGLGLGCNSQKKNIASILSNDDLSGPRLGCILHKNCVSILSNNVLSGLRLGHIKSFFSSFCFLTIFFQVSEWVFTQKRSFILSNVFSQIWDCAVIKLKTFFLLCLM